MQRIHTTMGGTGWYAGPARLGRVGSAALSLSCECALAAMADKEAPSTV